MTDLSPVFNDVLKRCGGNPIQNTPRLENIDEFLKEAYRINSHIASLNQYLRDIRQSYLSTSKPPRRTQLSRAESIKRPNDKQWQYLTDDQRDEIDAETKQLLRELDSSIRNLAEAEKLHHDTEITQTRKKYARTGLGAWGTWAAGGIAQSKSDEQEQAEGRSNAINMHRENVLRYLRQKLQECSSSQASMMEIRITREMEKNQSVLYKARRQVMPELGGPQDTPTSPVRPQSGTGLLLDEKQDYKVEDELTPEQLQIYEKDNQDMLKHYEATLDQVHNADKSLIEISELHSQLVENLATQSVHIDQLVADALNTAENVGGGNKELKKATERKSTAKYVFYASCGLSLFLIVYDLII